MVNGLRYAVLSLALIAGACGGSDSEDPEVATETAPAESAAPAADQDFLRRMSDHHQGMLTMADQAAQKASSQEVKDEARRMDEMQDAELEQMRGMLQQSYQESYEPKMMPSNQAMVDSLQQKTGADFDMAFRMNVVRHHEEALRMIDEMLPRLTNPEVRSMAEKMRADQQREIEEMRTKMGH